MRSQLAFAVAGRPVPQGSLRSLGKGKPTLHSNQARLLPWRAVIAGHAAEQAAAQGWDLALGAVSVTCTFTFARPAAHLHKDGSVRPDAPTHPIRRSAGDLDKLVRSVLDGITDSGAVWGDDSQVARIFAVKGYTVPGQPEGVAVAVHAIQ